MEKEVVTETRANRVIVQPEPEHGAVRRTSWSAVFAGALVALMTTFLLSLLFAGIGLQSLDLTSNQPASGLGTGSVVALVVTNLLALFLGGWVAGYLAGLPRRGDAFIHGILTWGVLTILTVFLLTTALGRFVGGVTSLVGGTVSTATQAVTAAAPDSAQGAGNVLSQIPGFSAVQGQIDQFLNQAGVQNPALASQELGQLIVNRVQAGESLTSTDAQNELETFLTQNSDLTEQEINQQVQSFSQQLEQTQQTVVEGTEEAASVSGLAALGLCAALLVGALVAAVGAAAGKPKDPYAV